MDVYVQVWNLLECRFTNRMPQTQALIWKSAADCTGDASYHRHERGACSVIELAHIMEMPSRNDKRVAWMELP